jgi:hypothetical protein
MGSTTFRFGSQPERRSAGAQRSIETAEKGLGRDARAQVVPIAAGPAGNNRRQDTRLEACKVRALWLLLHALGQVENPSEADLAAYVKRIACVDDMNWARSLAMHRLIEIMKKRAMRVLPGIVDGLRSTIDKAADKDHLNERQMQLRREADKALRASEGFPGYWAAWMALSEALGVQVAAEIAELGVRK